MLWKNFLPVVLAVASPLGWALADEPLRLERTEWPLRYVAYEFALEEGPAGAPRLNFERLQSRPQQIVERRVEAIVLENRNFRATLLPTMGRLHSFIHKPTRHEQLWINPAARPIVAHNDTGFWVTWGGIEHVLPRGEHGTSHALEWHYAIEEDSNDRKQVRMESIEPLTGLVHTVIYSARPDSPWLETTIRIENPGDEPQGFAHWTTAVLAPGGAGEVTPRTELIVPADRFVPADRPFNRWMQPLAGPPRQSPLRFVGSWQDIGDLMTTELTEGYYAAYSHEADEGVIRVFDVEQSPGLNIWTWGYPPSLDRQREYTARPPNRGYVEFWNGTAREFSEASLGVLRPGETMEWTEQMRGVHGLLHEPDLLEAIGQLAKP